MPECPKRGESTLCRLLNPPNHRFARKGLIVIRVALARASIPWVLLAGLFVVMLWSRMIQPGDLHDDDQSKTMAYTVDMIRNHQFALPRDMYRQPATKPPMYNWLTIPFLYVFQSWKGLVFSSLDSGSDRDLRADRRRGAKLLGANPSRPLQLPQPPPSSINPSMLPLGMGVVAAAIFLASQPVNRVMYLARPLDAGVEQLDVVLVQEVRDHRGQLRVGDVSGTELGPGSMVR